jgi:hypothetical protein
MRKLKIHGIWVAVVMMAGVLALAGCDDTSSTTITDVAGAAIAPWETEFTATSTGFTILTAATPVSNNPGQQTVEYAATVLDQVPTSGYQPGLLFSGLTADRTYNVYARTAEKTVGTTRYLAGTPAFGGQVDTLAAAPDSSVTWTWGGTVSDWGGDNGEFSFPAATATLPNPGNQTVQYNISTTSDPAVIAAQTSGWFASRSTVSLDRVAVSTQRYYVWARTAAVGTYPAGTPMSKPLTLPGAELSLGTNTWNPIETTPATSSSVTFTPNATFIRTPVSAVIDTLPIEYGLGSSESSAANITNWTTPTAATGNVTINSGLGPNADFYLWARTAASGSFAAGTPLRWETGVFAHTGGTSTTASQLRDDLNAMTPGSASLQADNNTVLVENTIVLTKTISIPQNVTLRINATGKTLKAGFNSITGSGTIEVVDGTLEADEHNVSVPIIVRSGGKFDSTANHATGSNTLIGDNGVIVPKSGSVTLRHVGSGTGSRYEYTINGGTTELGKLLWMGPSDSIAVGEGATLYISHKGLLSTEGRITVQKGGALVIVTITDFNESLVSTGSITIMDGAGFGTGNTPTWLTHVATTPVVKSSLILDPGGNIVIRGLVPTTEQPEKFRYTLSGMGAKVTDDWKIDDMIFEVAQNSILTVPADATGLTLTVGDTNKTRLIVNGTLELGAEDTTAATVLKGGKLEVNTSNGTLATGTVSGGARVINVRKGAMLELGGTTTVNTGGTINVYTGLSSTATPQANITGSVILNGKIVVQDGGVLQAIGTNAKITGNGDITVARPSGRLVVDGYGLKPFMNQVDFTGGTSPTTGVFGGSIEISGELQNTGMAGTNNIYIGTVGYSTSNSRYPGSGILLSAVASKITITFRAPTTGAANVPIYTLSGGGASVEGANGTAPNDKQTELWGRFVANTALSINADRILHFNGATLHVSTTNNLTGSATGTQTKGQITGTGRVTGTATLHTGVSNNSSGGITVTLAQ